MRKIIGLCVVGMLMSVYGNAVPAQQPSSSGQALNTEEASKAKEALKALGQAFGVRPPTESTAPRTEPPATPAPAEDHKTVGDAADKALDLVGKAVASVSATLEKVAPHIWRIMIKQQYAKALAGLVVPWGLLCLLLIYTWIVRSHWTKEQDGGDEDTKNWRIMLTSALPFLLGMIFCIWGVVNLSDSLKYLVNPEYYAVKDIVTMLLGQAPQ